ncbi:hypothetical protein [Actinomadura harenae]|uniref:Uncharacterized protein n=1 Tax=Actinomadura harenae TaxID=2483351 RepID=A0A3M2LU76_9ACTN|nr:hypothetical protein [Actinomadura harenae]RMI40440.1 hypothetical protein EBO15_26655 [Actinomadura harenae]
MRATAGRIAVVAVLLAAWLAPGGAVAATPPAAPGLVAPTMPGGNTVPWGTTPDGMAIKAFIREYESRFGASAPMEWPAITPGRNVAVFAFTLVNGGPVRRVVTANAPGPHVTGGILTNSLFLVFDEDYNIVQDTIGTHHENEHSEELLDLWLAENQISTSRVFSAESEREECDSRCWFLLGSAPGTDHDRYRTLRDNGGMNYTFGRTAKNVDRDLAALRAQWRAKGSQVVKPTAATLAQLALPCPAKPGAKPKPKPKPKPVAMAFVPLALAADDGPCGRTRTAPQAGPLGQALGSRDLGGVDFSTLQMRYMSDDPSHGRVQYAFSGRPAAPGARQSFLDGGDAVISSAADLRTWLVLDPSRFWVNLNPSEPDRIIDPRLGRTGAGRALLEADYAMKRTEGRLLDPRTRLGAEYWNTLGGPSGQVCYTSRMWIVPGDVQVREDGDTLSILKAALDVKVQALTVPGGCGTDPKVQAAGEAAEKRLVLPEIVRAVNTAPEYAPLRRAFTARVIAEWIRRRHDAGERTSFDGLIGSGDLGPAESTDGWRPRQVYDAFVRSFRRGDFTFTETTRLGDRELVTKMTFGGVDFSRLSPTKLDAAETDRRYPRLPETAKTSGTRAATAPDGSIWLGQRTAAPTAGFWDRTGNSVKGFFGGRTGLIVLIAAGLGVVAFGLRGNTRKRRTRP